MKTIESGSAALSRDAATSNGGSATGHKVFALRKDIRPDPGQPRREFPEGAQAELRGSIEANGIQDALVVRKDPEGKTVWMIIEGERRWRVAGELKIERLPIEVREMDEAQVRRYQRIVGTQRLNLSALEQAADAARELAARKLSDPKFTVADLAKELGRERASMYEVLRLNSLSAPVREALGKGLIDLTKAQLFGQVAPGLHPKLLKQATEVDYDGRTMSVKELKLLINDEYSRQLSGAGWKLDDAELVKQAGACATCPKRSGNIEGLGGNPNVCTDVKCFESKTFAHTSRVLSEAKKEGKRVIPSEVYERNSYDHKKPKDSCYQDSKGRAWGTLAKAAGIEPAITVDEDGEAIQVFTPEDRGKILSANKIRSSASGTSASERAAQKKRQEKETLYRTAAGAATVEILGKLVTDKGVNQTNIDIHDFVAKRRGLSQSVNDSRSALDKWFKDPKNHSWQAMAAMVVELLVCARWSGGGWQTTAWDKDFVAVCKLAGVDLDKLLKAAVKPGKGKGTAKDAKHAKGGKK